jgi:hypothetical protein
MSIDGYTWPTGRISEAGEVIAGQGNACTYERLTDNAGAVPVVVGFHNTVNLEGITEYCVFPEETHHHIRVLISSSNDDGQKYRKTDKLICLNAHQLLSGWYVRESGREISCFVAL